METLDVRGARRLALARAGLLKRRATGLPERASGHGVRARRAALDLLRRFGYLQLDTVSVAGARSHALVLLSRWPEMSPDVGEELLQPKRYEGDVAPIFEYWGHEASWIPNELYPAFEFRRQALRKHRWCVVLDEHPKLADEILQRARELGPFKSSDLEGEGGGPWWGFKLSKRVATCLWSCGELSIRERAAFQRTFDLPERTVPDEFRTRRLSLQESLVALLDKALDGHGWATTATLASTWRLRNLRPEIHAALEQMEGEGQIVACQLDRGRKEKPVVGWIRPADLELASSLRTARPNRRDAVLLSPFDPVLWDRARVKLLFGFDQVLEIFKPEPERVYGYYCLPVLAGEQLVSRVDLKAHRKTGELEIRCLHLKEAVDEGLARRATESALDRYADAVSLTVRR